VRRKLKGKCKMGGEKRKKKTQREYQFHRGGGLVLSPERIRRRSKSRERYVTGRKKKGGHCVERGKTEKNRSRNGRSGPGKVIKTRLTDRKKGKGIGHSTLSEWKKGRRKKPTVSRVTKESEGGCELGRKK